MAAASAKAGIQELEEITPNVTAQLQVCTCATRHTVWACRAFREGPEWTHAVFATPCAFGALALAHKRLHTPTCLTAVLTICMPAEFLRVGAGQPQGLPA